MGNENEIAYTQHTWNTIHIRRKETTWNEKESVFTAKFVYARVQNHRTVCVSAVCRYN